MSNIRADVTGGHDKARAAEKHKEDANAAFRHGNYQDAVLGYSKAIQANPNQAVYYSNRAMAYLKVRPCCHDAQWSLCITGGN